ncbi:hypothetical protein MRX96_021761 [Rhipicephalus microplus]
MRCFCGVNERVYVNDHPNRCPRCSTRCLCYNRLDGTVPLLDQPIPSSTSAHPADLNVSPSSAPFSGQERAAAMGPVVNSFCISCRFRLLSTRGHALLLRRQRTGLRQRSS